MDVWCPTCRNLKWTCPLPCLTNGRERRIDVILSMERTLDDLKASRTTGCPVCSALCDILLFYDEYIIVDGSNIVLRAFENGAADILPGRETASCIQMYTPRGSLPAWEGLPICDEVSSSPSAPQAFNYLKTRIRDCTEHHRLCKQERPVLPSRLLDIGLVGGSTARLISTEPGSVGRYAALSYCWGEEQHFTTTTATIRLRMAGIAMSELPASIRDAILLCRKLGIHYLWVDALCIIQDSPTDWETECARMASVYHNAFLTIAVSSAASATPGFMARPHGSTGYPIFTSEWVCDSGQQSKLNARYIHPSSDLNFNYPLDNLEGPLDYRGWAFQERALSTRLVSYGLDELKWRCREVSTCECRSDEKLAERTEEKSIFGATTAQEAHDMWAHAVYRFTSRSLTHPSDGLAAGHWRCPS